MSFFPLIKLLVKIKPDFLVSHLLTSIPFLIFIFLDLEDFLNYPKTADYLLYQHYDEFDYHPREALIGTYEKMRGIAEMYFPGVLNKDFETEEGESLAHIVFNNISSI